MITDEIDEARRPVMLASDLVTLDGAEIMEGYRDGLEGFPCSNNRSRSYWHGWQNGMTDKGRMEPTVYGRLLVQDVLRERRFKTAGYDCS